MSSAEQTAIVFAEVKMAKLRTDALYCGSDAFFLDIGVKGINGNSDAWMMDRGAKLLSFVDSLQKECF